MEDNKELVGEELTENVEGQTTEEIDDTNQLEEETTEQVEESQEQIKTYTDEDVDRIVGKKLARQESKLREEYEKKYGKLTNVLQAGTGKEDITEIADTFKDFYTKQGINIPNYEPKYSQRDLEVLAKTEAQDIIDLGYNDIVAEVDRLADLGLDGMNEREKLVFQTLADERTKQESLKELASIGVGNEVLEDSKFKEFTKQLNPDLSMKQKYELYIKFNPQPKGKNMGSMKTATPNKTKDYYTPDEARRLTSKDLDDPQVMKAVENSMKIWYEKGIQ